MSGVFVGIVERNGRKSPLRHQTRLAGVELKRVDAVARPQMLQFSEEPADRRRTGHVEHGAEAFPPGDKRRPAGRPRKALQPQARAVGAGRPRRRRERTGERMDPQSNAEIQIRFQTPDHLTRIRKSARTNTAFRGRF